MNSEIVYLFGYGSLINSQSRKETGFTKNTIPCTYKGLKRSWSMIIDPYKAIALNISEHKNCICNGVLVEIDSTELQNFDQRETGYKRIRLDPKRLVIMGNDNAQLLTATPIWAYVTQAQGDIPTNYKIQQSYVDVIITGCLEWGWGFAQQFVETTYMWNRKWLMDRDSPTYPRSLKGVYNTGLIDQFVGKYYI